MNINEKDQGSTVPKAVESVHEKATSVSNLPAVTTDRLMPRLTDKQREVALQLAEKIDPTAPQAILTFGETAQRGASDFSSRVLEGATLRDAGSTGELIARLHASVCALDTEQLTSSGGFFSRLRSAVTKYNPLSDRVGAFLINYRGVNKVVGEVATQMELARQEAFVTIEQLDELKGENLKYQDALRVAVAAATVTYNAMAEQYEVNRKGLGASADLAEYSGLKRQWNNLQRLDRRIHALDVSLALTYANHEEIEKVQELVAYDAEVMGEAVQHMVPNWKTNLALSITVLHAEDQTAVIQAARELTDKFVLENARAIGKLEDIQLTMQQRTFVAAEAVAAVNGVLADQLAKVKVKQAEAKVARTHALATIRASQERLALVMREDSEALMATSADGTHTLNVSAKSRDYDIAALLLPGETNVH